MDCVTGINYIDPRVDIELSEWHKHQLSMVLQYVMTWYPPAQSWQTHKLIQLFTVDWNVKTIGIFHMLKGGLFFHFLRKCRRTVGLLWSWSNRTEALTSNNCIAPYSVWLVVVPWLSGYNGDYIVIVSSYPSPLIEIIKSCTTPPPTHCCQEVNSGIIHKLWLLTN